MIYILDIINTRLVKAEIVLAVNKDAPLKKDGWNFDWGKLLQDNNSRTYFLKTIELPKSVEGAIQLRIENEMLIMDSLEIASHNIGRKSKKYDYVAGCLIAFACRESFKLEGNYKGFLAFVAKSKLLKWYSDKYGAKIALGQRMYIDDKVGFELIKEYLECK